MSYSHSILPPKNKCVKWNFLKIQNFLATNCFSCRSFVLIAVFYWANILSNVDLTSQLVNATSLVNYYNLTNIFYRLICNAKTVTRSILWTFLFSLFHAVKFVLTMQMPRYDMFCWNKQTTVYKNFKWFNNFLQVRRYFEIRLSVNFFMLCWAYSLRANAEIVWNQSKCSFTNAITKEFFPFACYGKLIMF